ncbi:MAG: EamA family transporter [Kiritimatiellia bacterium]
MNKAATSHGADGDDCVPRRFQGPLLMCASALCVAVGQLLWKMGGEPLSWTLLISGTAVYALATLLMMAAFRFGRLSTLQPLLSSAYVWGALFGVLFIGETYTFYQMIGMGLIVLGTIFVGRSRS